MWTSTHLSTPPPVKLPLKEHTNLFYCLCHYTLRVIMMMHLDLSNPLGQLSISFNSFSCYYMSPSYHKCHKRLPHWHWHLHQQLNRHMPKPREADLWSLKTQDAVCLAHSSPAFKMLVLAENTQHFLLSRDLMGFLKVSLVTSLDLQAEAFYYMQTCESTLLFNFKILFAKI